MKRCQHDDDFPDGPVMRCANCDQLCDVYDTRVNPDGGGRLCWDCWHTMATRGGDGDAEKENRQAAAPI